MAELETLRDHAREMATADHRKECQLRKRAQRDGWAGIQGCESQQAHPDHVWSSVRTYGVATWRCPGLCGGCVSQKDRDLWARIADELDDYLTDDATPLWEDA